MSKAITVAQTKPSDVKEIWNIIQETPNFFDDESGLDTLNDFHHWWDDTVVDSLTGYRGDKIIGCCYIDLIQDKFASLNIVVKRKELTQEATKEIAEMYLPQLFKKHNLKMVYGITRISNKASLKLMKSLGFKVTEVLKNFECVNGKFVDCVMAVKTNLGGGL